MYVCLSIPFYSFSLLFFIPLYILHLYKFDSVYSYMIAFICTHLLITALYKLLSFNSLTQVAYQVLCVNEIIVSLFVQRKGPGKTFLLYIVIDSVSLLEQILFLYWNKFCFFIGIGFVFNEFFLTLHQSLFFF